MNKTFKRLLLLVAFVVFALLQFLLIVGGWHYYASMLTDICPLSWQRLLTSRLFSYLGVVFALLFVLLPFYMERGKQSTTNRIDDKRSR